MPNTDIVSLISQSYPTFSKGQRLIAKYILDEYDKAAFMTASRLGKTVGVSESTVVRFAYDLGYDGYPAMRKALQSMIKNRLTAVQRIEVSRDLVDSKDIVKNVLGSDIEKIRQTLEEVDVNEFNRAVESISSARNIYILGLRSSKAISNFLGFYLNLLFPNVKVIDESSTSEIFEQIFRIRSDDVLIGISFPRYSTRTIKAMRYARDKGAEVIGLTDSLSSPVAETATIKLCAKSDMASFADSLVAPLSLVNAIIVAEVNRSHGNISADLNELEHIWAEYDVYDKSST